MKQILLITLLVFSGKFFSQNITPANFGDNSNFVIGLPKATHTELKLIKEELLQFTQITYSEFFFDEHILLIECEPHPEIPLEYSSIEKILYNYFGHDHVMRKHIVSFDELKAKGEKTDKFTIK